MNFIIRSILLISTITFASSSTNKDDGGYGLDCSWPIHSKESSCGNLLGDRKALYEDYLQGCRDKFGTRGGTKCDAGEEDRLAMSMRQPQSMVNYTSTGFKKIKAPKPLWDLISNHWNKNKDNKKVENWGVGNIYANNWKAPTYMVSVENNKLRGGEPFLKNQIWEAARPIIEEWTGMKVRPVSLYGIRVYTEGAILAPHVDRLPLVSSCIINIAQNVEEAWPLEVYDRHDRAVNVTMQPGDMTLYESGSLIHGRPFPLKGRYFANIFIHFEPTGEHLYDGKWDNDNECSPPYILPGSPEVENWRSRNPNCWKNNSPSIDHRPKGHIAASKGDIEMLKKIAEKNKEALHAKDNNQWQPLHEAVRGGHIDAVKFLVLHGADINAVTSNGEGSSPFHIALNYLSEDHPVAQYLNEIGAVDIGPDDDEL